MGKVELKKPYEVVSPDVVWIDKWGIRCECDDDDTISIIFTHRFEKYGIGPLIVSSFGEVHETVYEYIKKYIKEPIKILDSKDFLLRIWKSNNTLTSWGDDDDIKDNLRQVKTYFDNGNYSHFYYQNGIKLEEGNKQYSDINFGELDYFWDGYEENEIGMDIHYAYYETVNRLISNNTNINKADDTQQREFHLMTPDEKAEYLKNNVEKHQEKINYFKEGERVWVNKHGDVDPAYYHLTMYEENIMKITEKDIRRMVNESIKQLIRENNNLYLNDMTTYDYCIENLHSLINILKTTQQEVPKCVQWIINTLRNTYGIEIQINKEYCKFNNEGYCFTYSAKVIGDRNPYEDDIDFNNPEDVRDYIENAMSDLETEFKKYESNNYKSVCEIVRSFSGRICLHMYFNPFEINTKIEEL